MFKARLLFTDVHSLHGSAISSIQECLCGTNGDALILRIHQGDESLDGFSAVIPGKVANLR